MIRTIAMFAVALFVGSVGDLSPIPPARAQSPEPSPQSCSFAGWSQLAQKKAGLSSYPALCTMPSCRAASAGAHGHTSVSGQDPLCNPVTGANCGTVLYFHYDYVLSGTPSGACPAAVVNAAWSTSAN